MAVSLSMDQIISLMETPKNIRNVSIIAHFNHVRSKLLDSLRNTAGILPVFTASDGTDTSREENKEEKKQIMENTFIGSITTVNPR